MNMNRFSGWAVAVLALSLPACGNPSAHLSFKAPAGYQAPKNVFGMAQIWSSPDDKQALMLMKLPVKVDPKTALRNAGMKDATIKSQQAIKICGNQPATHVVVESTGKDHNTIDMIMTSTGDASYMSMYSRPVGSPADKASEEAIRSLCAV